MSDRHFVHHEDEVQLAKILKESKPWLERYATTLIYGLAAILAVAAVFVYFSRKPPANAGLSQSLLAATLENTPTPESYQAIADEAGDTQLGITSRLRQAELLLNDAVEGMFTNRKTALENIDKAKTAFERLSENKNVKGSTRERVLAGLARTLETRCDGTPDSIKAAVGAWESILKEFPDSKMFKELAEDRVKKLPQQAEFLTWFAAQDPKPADDLQLPQDGPGQVPAIPNLGMPSLGMPDIGLPSLTPGPAPEAPKPEAAKSEEPKTVEPKADAPKTDAPADAPKEEAAKTDEPKAETPAEAPKAEEPKKEEAPAAEPPAATPPADAPKAADAPAETGSEPKKAGE